MSQELVEKYTSLDRAVRDAERELTTLQAQEASYRAREQEVYDQLKVSGIEALEEKLATLQGEVEKELADWQLKVARVSEAIKEVENRVAYVR